MTRLKPTKQKHHAGGTQVGGKGKSGMWGVAASFYGLRETGQVLPVSLIRSRPLTYLQGHTQTTKSTEEEHRAGLHLGEGAKTLKALSPKTVQSSM